MYPSLHSGLKLISLDFYNVNTKSYVLMVVKITLSWKQTTWSLGDRRKELERTCCLLLQLFNPKDGDGR